jgi:hypothetical protein
VIQVRTEVVGQGNVLSLWFRDVCRDDLLHISIYRLRPVVFLILVVRVIRLIGKHSNPCFLHLS